MKQIDLVWYDFVWDIKNTTDSYIKNTTDSYAFLVLSNLFQHADGNVSRVLIGNKCDLVDERVSYMVDYERFIFVIAWPYRSGSELFTRVLFILLLPFSDHLSVSEQRVRAEEGEALAAEFHIKFFETSAKESVGVKEAFAYLAMEVKNRILTADYTEEEYKVDAIRLTGAKPAKQPCAC